MTRCSWGSWHEDIWEVMWSNVAAKIILLVCMFSQTTKDRLMHICNSCKHFATSFSTVLIQLMNENSCVCLVWNKTQTRQTQDSKPSNSSWFPYSASLKTSTSKVHIVTWAKEWTKTGVVVVVNTLKTLSWALNILPVSHWQGLGFEYLRNKGNIIMPVKTTTKHTH